MAIRDLRKAPPGMVMRTDVAIIGGGAAGLAIARELAGTRIHVTVIDSGGFEVDENLQSLNQVENVGAPVQRSGAERIGRGYSDGLSGLNDIQAFELRNRGLGGSTRTWIGKCAAFDEIDFEKREWIPGSGWPISRSSIEPFLDRAAKLLNLGPNVYDERLYGHLKTPPTRSIFQSGELRPFFWQFSHQPGSFGAPMRFVHLARSLDTPNIDLLTHATVVQIRTIPNGRRVTSLEVRNPEGRTATVHAPAVILCGGGIENARLLLASNAVSKLGVGNANGVVGRYLADHPRTVLARFPRHAAAEVARLFTFYGLSDPQRDNFYLHGLSLNPKLQQKERLLNCAAYPVQVLSEDDPWQALRRLSTGLSPSSPWDLLSVAKSPNLIAQGLLERFFHRRGLRRKVSELRFDVMVEQRPNPQSRVTLSRNVDILGMPLPKVDWRIGDQEIETVRKFAQLTSAAFTRAGFPDPLLPDWVINESAIDVPFMDMAHPSGTTRMGMDPKTSVVDSNCMVHDVEGLFVAGSSVFPTPGHANPTLTIIALALRLADHMRAYCRTPSVEGTAKIGTPVVESMADRSARAAE